MTEEQIRMGIAQTGIRVCDEADVPINGKSLPVPYLVIRTKETIEGSDNGLVQWKRIDWEVALFTANKAPELNRLLLAALRSVGRVEVLSFPDGTPYQTTFKFKTIHY